MTFSKYKKTKFWVNFELKFFIPTPSEGVLKKWKFSKLVIEPKLLNMIYRTHKKRNKSKIWALYLKNRCFKITFSNMGPKTTPSLISKGGGDQIPPPWKIGVSCCLFCHCCYDILLLLFCLRGYWYVVLSWGVDTVDLCCSVVSW